MKTYTIFVGLIVERAYIGVMELGTEGLKALKKSFGNINRQKDDLKTLIEDMFKEIKPLQLHCKIHFLHEDEIKRLFLTSTAMTRSRGPPNLQ